MWEPSNTTSPRLKSLRRILTFCLSALVVAFSWAVIHSTNSYAVTATWSSASSISYESNTYNGPVSDAINTKLGIPTGSKTYTSVDPAATTGTTSPTEYSRKIRAIYFNNATTIEQADSANYKTFTYIGPENFTDPSAVSVISIDKQADSAISSSGSSCAISGGMGWMICPITNFLAKGMDWVFDVIRSFLVVRPVMTDQNSSLYRAWSYARSVANIAFVIAFLFIIYSQLTSVGISNYGIKKLLPRLIIAAVLVNISYFICAIAVDLSNILGYSIQDVLISIRNGVAGTTGNNWDLMNWSSITGFVLSGGAVATASTIALVSTLSTYGIAGSIFLLLPTLLTGILAVLVALVIMAARQALVTILIILAPLAFVSYLLPNTEKWFEKWKSTLTTMLMLFPVFSLLYGGSQLASALIIQNADSINTLILGMILQVVPLFMLPFLIKMSGSIIGKVAGVINNPSKGPIDRARQFTKDRTDVMAAKRLGMQAKPHQFLRQNAQRRDHARRRREGWKSSYGTMSDARWANSSDFSDIDQNTREYQERKALGESHSELRYSESKISGGRIQELDVRIREIKLQSENAKLVSNVQWENNNSSAIHEEKTRSRVLNEQLSLAKMTNDNNFEMSKSKKYSDLHGDKSSVAIQSLMQEARDNAQALAIQAMQKNSIGRVLHNELADELLSSDAKRAIAGASIVDDHGEDSALAYAIGIKRSAYGKVVDDRNQLIKHFNLSGGKRQDLAMGGKFDLVNNAHTPLDAVIGEYVTSDGTTIQYNFQTNDDFNREAAIETQLKAGSFDEISSMMMTSGSHLRDYRTTISAAIPQNGLANKAFFWGAKFIDDVSQGKVTGINDYYSSIYSNVIAGTLKAEDVAGNHANAIKIFYDSIDHADELLKEKPGELTAFKNNLEGVKTMARQIINLKDPVGNNASSSTKTQFENIYRKLALGKNPTNDQINAINAEIDILTGRSKE